MTSFLKYVWALLMILLALHGVTTLRNEWKRKFIHDHGEMVAVRIDGLNCPNGIMTFRYGGTPCEKNIDARTCVLLNVGQTIKLKHLTAYPESFLFANERSPNRFVLGGLEIALGLIGLISNWPLIGRKRKMQRHFSHNFLN